MIYLDNSATTPLCAAAKDAMHAAMEAFGNPSSLHTAGTQAAKLLQESRAAIGEALTYLLFEVMAGRVRNEREALLLLV